MSASSSGLTLSCSGYSDRLTDFALKLLTDFCQGKPFLKESHFITAKDKIVRGLKGYFESSRADTLAFHYRNLLLSSKGGGVKNNLELAEGMTLTDVARQQQNIWADEPSEQTALIGSQATGSGENRPGRGPDGAPAWVYSW